MIDVKSLLHFTVKSFYILSSHQNVFVSVLCIIFCYDYRSLSTVLRNWWVGTFERSWWKPFENKWISSTLPPSMFYLIWLELVFTTVAVAIFSTSDMLHYYTILNIVTLTNRSQYKAVDLWVNWASLISTAVSDHYYCPPKVMSSTKFTFFVCSIET